MTSLGSTPRLRTNCRLLLMRDKAFQEEQRKRQKIMGSPRSLNPSSRNHPPLNNTLVITNNGHNNNLSTTTTTNNNNEGLLNGILGHPGSGIINGLEQNHPQLDMMQHGEDFGGIYDSPISPYSLTPSSMTTSISEYDAIFEDFNEIVEKEGQQQQQSSTFSNYNEKVTKSEGGGKNPLKTSSSYPTMKSTRLTLPSKLDPSDFPDIDSYKKEKHNIVEKKRRYKINDCIQELADLLPDSYDVDLNMKKGYILEKSVEYIHELKKDHDKKAELEKRHKELEREHRQMQLELQTLKRSLQQQQQQQQQQFLIVSPTFQQPQQQHHISPQPNQIFLAVNDNNFSAVDHSMNNIINPSVFINDYSDSDVMTQDVGTINNNNKSLVDTDFLLSNLQLTKELTGNDRQELNSFVNLDDFANDDVMMTDFVFPNPTDQF